MRRIHRPALRTTSQDVSAASGLTFASSESLNFMEVQPKHVGAAAKGFSKFKSSKLALLSMLQYVQDIQRIEILLLSIHNECKKVEVKMKK